ncbi:MAG: 30S ribosomal protein S6 [Acidimicrobiales bacterium]|jgi:small subunit ribosomal protein S6
MRPYEAVLIFDVKTDGEAMQAVVDRLSDAIRASGGNPGKIDRWGKRQFAYEVDHRQEGYYILLEMTCDPGELVAINRMLTLTDELVRHKIVRVPDGVAGRRRAEAPRKRPATAPSGRKPRAGAGPRDRGAQSAGFEQRV